MLSRTLAPPVLALLFVASLVGSVAAQAPSSFGLRPIEDPIQGIASVVPESWQDLGYGLHARGTPPDDLAVIAIQSTPVTPDQLWPSLLPQLALTEIPQPSGTFSSAIFDWTLYRVDVEQGGLRLTVELGMAEQADVTYVVLLQAHPDEFEALREAVLVPALRATAPLAPQPTPDPSTFDYTIEEVTFPGGSEDVQLAGTLTLPSGPGPHPVVVMMSGSGAQDRDESLRPVTLLKPFAVLADALTSAGVGVLRYDDRGVGGSTGDYASATIQQLAGDARAALDYLETRADVDTERLGLFGHSEGGLYAAMLGASDPRVAYIGMMAPGVVDMLSLIVAQNEASLRAEGESEQVIEATRAFSETVLPLALEGDIESVRDLTIAYYRELWDLLEPIEQAVVGDRDAWAEQLAASAVEQFLSDQYRSRLAYDPAVDWARVSVPVLAIFGGKDVQVLAEPNAAALQAALEGAGNRDAEVITFEDANHLFQEAETGAFSEYSRLAPEFVDGFVETIVDWMTERTGVAG